MKRTPETILLLLILVFSAGLVLGLTYAPCYASLCSEEFFPYETRLHIAAYYAILASTALALFVRAYSLSLCQLSTTYLTRKPLPILQNHLSLGGLALSIWIVGLTLATTAFWVSPEIEFWSRRTDDLEWGKAKVRLAVTGIIGHHADILLGLVIVPVSRNSLLGRIFYLHQSTLLYTHKLVAYLLVVAAFAHGAAYYTFVGEYRAAGSERKNAFNVDNPTLTISEAESRGGWWYATLPSGMFAFLLMLVITITSLPILRRKSYNTFYYAHIICSVIIFIALSVHASTDFYFLLPGLLLWMVDWAWRFFRGQSGLGQVIPAVLENVGSGWYKISLTRDVDRSAPSGAGEEMMVPVHPIQSFYLNFPSISKLQNHAFTAAMVAGKDSGPVFLLQRAQGKTEKKLGKEWTWKLGALVPGLGDIKQLDIRLEGPYMPNTRGYQTASHVICMVGGTGLTGAYSIAHWWLKWRQHERNAKFHLVWSLRQSRMAEFQDWQNLKTLADATQNMTVSEHVSSIQGRLDALMFLKQQLTFTNAATDSADTKIGRQRDAWVYCLGPEGFLSTVENACIELKRDGDRDTRGRLGRHAVSKLDWYLAKWEV